MGSRGSYTTTTTVIREQLRSMFDLPPFGRGGFVLGPSVFGVDLVMIDVRGLHLSQNNLDGVLFTEVLASLVVLPTLEFDRLSVDFLEVVGEFTKHLGPKLAESSREF